MSWRVDVAGIVENAANRVAAAYAEPLAPLRARRPSTGGGGGRRRDGGTPVPPHVLQARSDAVSVVTDMVRWIVAGRDLRHDGARRGDVESACAFLRTHAEWVAAQPEGSSWAGMLDEASRRLDAVVTPRVKDSWRIGYCPQPRSDEPDAPSCGGEVRARLDGWGGASARCVRCGIDADLTWWRERIRPASRVTVAGLVDALLVEGVTTSEKAVMRLIERGVLDVVGRDRRGRRLVDRAEAVSVVIERRARRAGSIGLGHE